MAIKYLEHTYAKKIFITYLKFRLTGLHVSLCTKSATPHWHQLGNLEKQDLRLYPKSDHFEPETQEETQVFHVHIKFVRH